MKNISHEVITAVVTVIVAVLIIFVPDLEPLEEHLTAILMVIAAAILGVSVKSAADKNANK